MQPAEFRYTEDALDNATEACKSQGTMPLTLDANRSDQCFCWQALAQQTALQGAHCRNCTGFITAALSSNRCFAAHPSPTHCTASIFLLSA